MDKIIHTIRELPPLPLVVQKLLAVMRNESSCADDVTEVLNSDQALAGKVLKLVNSSFYGFSGEISTITRAVVVLGHRALRNLALGFGMSEAMSTAAGALDDERFWNHTITSAASARTLAPCLQYPDPEEAFIAGLLHDIGQFVLAFALREEYQQVLNDGEGDLVQREKRLLGIGHNQVGQKLLAHWQLPTRLCNVARFHHTAEVAASGSEPLVTMVSIADLLSYVRGAAEVGPKILRTAHEVCPAAGLRPIDCGQILDQVDRMVDDTRAFVQIANLPGGDELARPALAELPTSFAMVGADSVGSQWAQAVLEYLGHTVVPATEFLIDGEPAAEVEIALLDATGLSVGEIAQLEDRLWGKSIPLVMLVGPGGEQAVPAPWRGKPMLPYIFNQQCLDQLLGRITGAPHPA
jgi:HD-like signal output (HDOD) protein